MTTTSGSGKKTIFPIALTPDIKKEKDMAGKEIEKEALNG